MNSNSKQAKGQVNDANGKYTPIENQHKTRGRTGKWALESLVGGFQLNSNWTSLEVKSEPNPSERNCQLELIVNKN